MRFYTKLQRWALVMTIGVLLSDFALSFSITADENEQQLLSNEATDTVSRADVMSTSANGISLNYSEIEIAVGESRALVATISPSGYSVQWQSSNTSIATVSNGVVTGKKIGTITVLAMFMDSERNVYEATCVVHVRLADGRYYLKNKQTGCYADIKGPTMASGTTIHQWAFNGNNSQWWIFTHLGDGYYSIKSANSSTAYYLGVINDSSGLDVDIVLRSGSLTNGMKWKIEPTVNGAFKLIPKTGESKGYVLATTTSSSTNGAKLIQGAYVNNNSYRDEWELEHVDPVVNIEVVYDNAFFSRYADAPNRISYQINALQEKYLSEFGIRINCSNLSLFSSYTDIKCSTSFNSQCNHSSDTSCYNSSYNGSGNITLKTYHHNNIYNILYNIPYPDPSSSLKMAYTGHDNCIAVRDAQGTFKRHADNPYNGLANRPLGLALVMRFSTVSAQTFTTVHEFGHLYGVIDHYGGSGIASTNDRIEATGNPGYSRLCMYGEDKINDNVVSNLIICEGCKDIINENRNKYNHG